jgi:aminoglycoside/choline kinase family phosphotransferase
MHDDRADPRLASLRHWLTGLPPALGLAPASLRPASDDASFRRYFRLDSAGGTLIAMDAPPPQEDVRPFLHAAQALARAGLSVPAVHAADPGQGFVLLQDFGSLTYLQALDERTARTHRQHREIIAALKARNPDWVEAAMSAHLFSILNDPSPDPD